MKITISVVFFRTCKKKKPEGFFLISHYVQKIRLSRLSRLLGQKNSARQPPKAILRLAKYGGKLPHHNLINKEEA
jgi:hypothetical protein